MDGTFLCLPWEGWKLFSVGKVTHAVIWLKLRADGVLTELVAPKIHALSTVWDFHYDIAVYPGTNYLKPLATRSMHISTCQK